jgi:FAD/FMN-containing dehydrogenase
MSNLRPRIKKYRFAFLVPFLAVLILAVKKAVYYSADPVSEKDCDPKIQGNSPQAETIISLLKQRPEYNLSLKQKGGTVNDASCLNQTQISGIVNVQTEEDIRQALIFAKENDLKLSIAGARHSMGGQAFAKDGLVLDMTAFKKMSVNQETKTLTVQSGTIWKDVQSYLHDKNLAVKSMQSIDILTVGGTIGANAHGIDHTVGSVARTIKSMRVILSDGTIQTVSPSEKPELYQAIIGGYGLFGVVLEADIEVTDNKMYHRSQEIINYRDFPALFKNSIEPDSNYKLIYAHLSPTSKSFLSEMVLYTYKEPQNSTRSIPPLKEQSYVKITRFFFNYAKHGLFGQNIKWWLEKNVLPRYFGCNVSRNTAVSEPEACFISRNQAMSGSQKFIKNRLKDDTDIFQEYFIPRDNFVPFVDGMRDILKENDIHVMNASVRVVNKDDVLLNYAKEDVFSIVLYLNQKVNDEESQKMEHISQQLIDLARRHGGTFYLTYQLNYTNEQLRLAYPEIDTFFAQKKKYDPDLLFVNKFYDKYSKL